MERVTSGSGPELRTDRIKARLAPNRGDRGGFSLIVDHTTQSHVNPDDPRDLQLEYVRLIAAIIDGLFPAGQALSVLHLGGGALSMPRYLSATRPGSTQHVVELYQELYEFVIEHLPLDQTGLTAEFADGRAAVERMTADAAGPRFDVIIVDVFSGDVAPRHISTAEFFEQAATLLTPAGIVITNTLASHGLAFTREALATLGSVFSDVIAVGNPGVTAGERIGNVELVAARHPPDAGALEAVLAGQPRTIGVIAGDATARLAAGAAIRRDR